MRVVNINWSLLISMERKRKKTVTATIKAEHIGGKEYRLIEILDKD